MQNNNNEQYTYHPPQAPHSILTSPKITKLSIDTQSKCQALIVFHGCSFCLIAFFIARLHVLSIYIHKKKEKKILKMRKVVYFFFIIFFFFYFCFFPFLFLTSTRRKKKINKGEWGTNLLFLNCFLLLLPKKNQIIFGAPSTNQKTTFLLLILLLQTRKKKQ